MLKAVDSEWDPGTKFRAWHCRLEREERLPGWRHLTVNNFYWAAFVLVETETCYGDVYMKPEHLNKNQNPAPVCRCLPYLHSACRNSLCNGCPMTVRDQGMAVREWRPIFPSQSTLFGTSFCPPTCFCWLCSCQELHSLPASLCPCFSLTSPPSPTPPWSQFPHL